MNMCRACLSTNTDVEMKPLDQSFLENYNLLTNLNITLTDGQSNKLCMSCWNTVENFIIFREKCISSESTLRDMKLEKTDVKYLNFLHIKEELTCIKEEDCTNEDLMDSFDGIHSDLDEHQNLDIKPGNVVITKIKHKKKRKLNKIKKTLHKEKNCLNEVDFPDKLDLINANGDATQDLIPCGLCSTLVTDKTSLMKHLENHRKDISCQYCFEGFLDFPHILSHRICHLTNNKGNCPICWKHFRSHFYLECHIRTTHTKEEFNGLRCKICLQKYNTPLRLRKHVEITHSEKVFVCNFCSKSCKSKQSLKSHMRVHSTEKKYVCDSCGYSCKFPGTLKDHKLRKHSLEKFECRHCSRMFVNQELKNEHKCVQLFICAICGKEFKQRASYTRHTLTHSDKRLFECSRCPAKYKSKMALKVHVDRHDGVRTKECEYCSAKFYSASVLIKHRRVHTGEKPYTCKLCKKAFTGRHNMKVHMKVHGIMLVVKRNAEIPE